MDPITLAAIGGGLGLGKGMLDARQEKKDREMEAQIAMWSPWTGMQAQRVKRADPLGSAMQGGLTAAAYGKTPSPAPTAQALSGPIGGSQQASYEAFAAEPVNLQDQVAPQYNLSGAPMQPSWMQMQQQPRYNLGR